MTNNKIFWLRFAAAMIDTAFLSSITGIIQGIYYLCDIRCVPFLQMWLNIALVYELLFEMLPSRGTPGMLMLGLRLDFGRTRVPAIRALWRTLLKWLFAIPVGLGFLSGFFFSDRRTFYDRITGARVTKNGVGATGKKTPCIIRHYQDKTDEVFTIPAKGFIMGRNPQLCNFLFKTDEAGISGCHCSIAYSDRFDTFILEDLDSSFGTFTADGAKLPTGKLFTLKTMDSFYLAQPSNLFTVCFKEILQ